jgi:predicted DNA-binding WGR domain protein
MSPQHIDTSLLFKDFDIREMIWIIPEINRRRFYRIEIVPGLFNPTMVRAWGRIGCHVRVKVDFFDNMENALNGANKLLLRKFKKGYRIITDPLVKNALPVHPVEIKDLRIERKKFDDNLYQYG